MVSTKDWELESFAGLPAKLTRNSDSIGMVLGIYSSGGVGKTTTIAKVANRYGPGLWVDAEGGVSVIKHIDNIQYVEPTRFSHIEKVIKELQGGNHPFKFICLDNMTEIQNLCIQSIAGPNPVQIQHWGQCTALMLKLVRDARELSRTQGMHIFFSVWDAEEKDEQGVVIKRGVGFTPSLARQFPGIVNYVCQMTPVNTNPDIRILDFTVSTKTDAKFRSSPGDKGSTIPLKLWAKVYDDPIGDMIATSIYGEPFPEAKYKKPT